MHQRNSSARSSALNIIGALKAGRQSRTGGEKGAELAG
jgi:hypothetical protein